MLEFLYAHRPVLAPELGPYFVEEWSFTARKWHNDEGCFGTLQEIKVDLMGRADIPRTRQSFIEEIVNANNASV